MKPIHEFRSRLLIVVFLPLCIVVAALEAAFWAARDEITDARNQWAEIGR